MSSPIFPSNKEKIKIWLRDEASSFSKQYFSLETHGNSHPALNVLNRLCQATESLLVMDRDLSALREISVIMRDSDVSAFEVIHSGLVNKILQYLTLQDPHLRDLRIRRFLYVFLGCPVSNCGVGCLLCERGVSVSRLSCELWAIGTVYSVRGVYHGCVPRLSCEWNCIKCERRWIIVV